MKKIVKITFLFFWLAAIVAPSISTILDLDNDLVVSTMSEEEPTEQEKKDPAEEKIVCENFADFSLIASLNEFHKGTFHTTNYSNHTLEILLPPPEHII